MADIDTLPHPVPERLRRYMGAIMDADAHEYTPVNMWEEQFGSVVRPFVDAHLDSKMPIRAHVDADDAPIDADQVWNTKFAKAPGAFDFDRRLEVMDYTGVRRQLIFPGSVGLYGASFFFRAEGFPDMYRGITGDRKGYALQMIRAHNDFALRVARASDRLRMVAVALAPDVDSLIAEVKRLMDGGVRAVWLPSAALPGGVSPAHPDLYPLWDMLQAADAPVLAHVGADFEFLTTAKWRDAPAFVGWKAGEEFQMDPWTLSTLHLPVQNFLATMVLGGVFEAFPNLRFGACEVTAQWVGPLAQNLDFWHANSRKFSLGNMEGALPIRLQPSDYIRRNTRFSIFDIEPVDTYIEQFNMPELYCYASDYPHPEGGRAPMADVSGKLAKFDESITRKVFVENGSWLLPD
ncbi:amidohydrolase family protein [Sphingomonas montanisoli]|uniref:Amidohydrolase family protein n=1 Tax=Sphingomonas montanisoli TaxID=2606412 RepID=A0A5D9CH24_9SPHN|nr:amidohydrolase family protein [Sphingomonas montanisoli]TZG29385.1 amidohydrolase family protein [Sphingomonas montanisoli]